MIVVALLCDTDDAEATRQQIAGLLAPYKAPDTRGEARAFNPYDPTHKDVGLILGDLTMEIAKAAWDQEAPTP